MDEGQRTVLCVAKPYAIQKQIEHWRPADRLQRREQLSRYLAAPNHFFFCTITVRIVKEQLLHRKVYIRLKYPEFSYELCFSLFISEILRLLR